MKLTFLHKISAAYALITLAFMLTVGGVVFFADLEHKRKTRLASFNTTIASLERAVLPNLVASDYSSVEEIMEWAGEQADFMGLRLFDSTGAVLYQREKQHDLDALHAFHFWQGGHYTREQELQLGGRSYGRLQAEFNEHQFIEQEFSMMVYMAIFSIVSSIVIWIVSAKIMRRSFSSLLELREMVDNLESVATDAEQEVMAARLLQHPAHYVKSRLREKIGKIMGTLMDYKRSLDMAGMVLELDEQFRIVSANRKYLTTHGVTMEDIRGRTYEVSGHPIEKIKESISRDGTWSEETKSRSANMGSYWSVKTIVPLKDSSVGAYLVMELDTTPQKEAEMALEIEKLEIGTTLGSLTDAVISVDSEGYVRYANKNFYTLFKPDSLTNGIHVDELATTFGVFNPKRVNVGALSSEEKPYDTRDGASHILTITYAPKRTGAQADAGTVIIVRDVSTTKKMEAELVWQANHDPLTGLFNRSKFEQVAEETLFICKKTGNSGTLLYIDLDQFKIVNDTCGHAAGDELLQQIAHVVQGTLRSGDILARLGGDEFGVVLPHCSRDEAVLVANRIRESILGFSFVWKTSTFRVGASIGMAMISADAPSVAEMLAAADASCYLAKESGRNMVCEHSAHTSEVASRRSEMGWVSTINQALDNNQFVIYCQEIVPLKPGLPRKIELLTRMLDSDGNLIPPGTYIPAAERYQIMSKIDEWVIDKAMSCIREMSRETEIQVAINLSANSLSSQDFSSYVLNAIEVNSVDAKSICLEITETAAISSFKTALSFINAMRKKGAKIALDDFGVGFSSFSYLKSMPVDILKIDGSYINTLDSDLIALEMVRSMITVAHAMGIIVVAEFVDRQEILDILQELGCDYAQGYYLHKPEPLADYKRREMVIRKTA